MRRVAVVVVAVVLGAVSSILTVPADAGSYAWHTMMTNRKARFQACKRVIGTGPEGQPSYEVRWRVNNRFGSRWVQFTEVTSDGGAVLSGGSLRWVAPHTKKGPIVHSPEYDSSVAALRTKYGHHRRSGTVGVAAIGLC